MNLKDIKGIGPKVLMNLNNRGINDIKSLIYTFPSSYSFYKLNGFNYYEEFNAKAVLIDEIKITKLKTVRKISFDCIIDDIKYTCVAFNMDYIKKVYKIGDNVVIIGKYNKDYREIQIEKIMPQDKYIEGIVPEYNIEGISDSLFSKIVKEALDYYQEKDRLIPDKYYQKYGYPLGKELLIKIHFPKVKEDYISALNALKYHELLSFSIKLQIIRDKQLSLRKEPKNWDINKIKDFIKNGIPFELTIDQKKAVNDILKYLGSNLPLNMLLEGDVGSGKTIVALLSTYAVYTSSYQSLVIAPTETLAKQHYETFSKFLNPYNVRVELLTSSVTAKNRKLILNDLKNGDIDIIIGTHSLISDEVVFKNLGFIVCDEQHKFGVDHRKKLSEKGNNPDILYMTATPIPRTLALTFFSDLILETIYATPSNRKDVRTYCHTFKQYKKVLDFVRTEINDGRQAYFVASCIDENPADEYKSVLRIKEDLNKYYTDLKIGLLHGKLDPKEKEDVLNKFKNKEIDIIVSTTVIEVGIDNPNASCMVIIDANKFGLSTLHQLRGRVGRGEYPGYCFLLVEKKEYMDRIKVLEDINDGFKIAEQDLIDRGPGDFLGTEQSGMIKFNFANLYRDKMILDKALMDAKELSKDKIIKEYYEARLYSEKFD